VLPSGRRRFLRDVLALASAGMLSGCGLVVPRAPPQRPTRLFRIGTIVPSGAEPKNIAGLVEGMRDLGWLQGQTVVFEHRIARVNEGLVVRVGELIDLKVDVIVAAGNEAIRVASSTTGTIPIVMAISNDPVGAGLIASIARPGGNVTGVTNLGAQLGAKRLQRLKEVAPGAVRVAVVWDSAVLGRPGIDAELSAAARALAVQLDPHPVVGGGQVWQAFDAATDRGADAILLLSDALAAGLTSTGYLERVRVPTLVESDELARAGGLLAYGPSVPALFRQSAGYVDKILRGAKPADLPIEQPTAFDLVVNLKTARVLGLTVPPSIVTQATTIIQ